MALASFEPCIAALRCMIDMALSSTLPCPSRLLFTSSVSVVHRKSDSRCSSDGKRTEQCFAGTVEYEPVPEKDVDLSAALGSGYSESKWVSEQLLALASRETPLHTISLRCGQIAGSRNGAWNVQEWVPSLIKSSIHLGCLPLLPEVRIVPSVTFTQLPHRIHCYRMFHG